jgi:RES domain-containing protein
MKPLLLDSSMTSMAGVFYPTGHVFALFPDEDCVRQAAAALQTAGHAGEIAYASPEVILQDIAQTQGTADTPFPSVGAEGDIVRRMADLAGTGHHGMLVALADEDDPQAVATAMASEGAVAAFHYRTFVIEDLITPPMVQDTPTATDTHLGDA